MATFWTHERDFHKASKAFSTAEDDGNMDKYLFAVVNINITDSSPILKDKMLKRFLHILYPTKSGGRDKCLQNQDIESQTAIHLERLMLKLCFI